jgi:hypothetical protein
MFSISTSILLMTLNYAVDINTDTRKGNKEYFKGQPQATLLV